jgi:SAM-dependent methyltransferase
MKEFGATLLGWYRGGLLAMMVDLGYRTGLFEAAARGPATSAALAARAGLTERYVREWLGALTVGGVFQYDRATGTYTLPPEHVACLTGTSATNLAPRSQMTAMLGARLPQVAACFRAGGGVPYAAFRPDFTDLQDSTSRLRHDVFLLDGFLAAVPGLTDRLAAGIAVADLGCGTGHAVNLLARAYPASRVVGYEIAEDALERGRAEAAAWGLTNARFARLDVTRLPAEPKFDLITAFDAIHDQADPAAVLRRAHEALAPDGLFLMLDVKAASDLAENVATPQAAVGYAVSVLHCMTVSLAEGGAGLGTMWGEQTARRMLAEAGFTAVAVVDAPDGFNSLYTCQP